MRDATFQRRALQFMAPEMPKPQPPTIEDPPYPRKRKKPPIRPPQKPDEIPPIDDPPRPKKPPIEEPPQPPRPEHPPAESPPPIGDPEPDEEIAPPVKLRTTTDGNDEAVETRLKESRKEQQTR